MNKINLHCHSMYSDGFEPLSNMFYEHQKQGFSAYVATDHLYPTHYGDRSLTKKTFGRQALELLKLTEYTGYPHFQGIELALYQEEIIVIGREVIKGIFDIVENNLGRDDIYLELMDYILENKDDCACILCHPQLNPIVAHQKPDLYPKLYMILDGYERFNSGHDFFKERPLGELESLKPFYNSDAHFLDHIHYGNNEHENPITTEKDLIKWIKRHY